MASEVVHTRTAADHPFPGLVQERAIHRRNDSLVIDRLLLCLVWRVGSEGIYYVDYLFR